MFKEGKGETLGFADAAHTSANRSLQFVYILAAAISELLTFHVAPECFYRIQIWRIAGQSFRSQPTTLAGKVFFYDSAFVCR